MFKLDQATIDEISSGYHVPAQPKVLQQLQGIMLQKERDLNQVASILEKDVELAGVVLKTINSPLFGLRKSVSSIRQAVIALGFENVYIVVTTCLLRQAFVGNSCISLGRFWDQATETAVWCKTICETLKTQVSPDDAYITGLFHDCGIATMSLSYDDYVKVLQQANQSEVVSLDTLERKSYQHDHCRIGAVISSSWNISEDVVDVIFHHHDLDYQQQNSSQYRLELWCILRIATELTVTQRQGHHESGWLEAKPFILRCFDLTDDELNEKLDAIVSELCA